MGYEAQASALWSRYVARIDDAGVSTAPGLTRAAVEGQSFQIATGDSMKKITQDAIAAGTWAETRPLIEDCVDITAQVTLALDPTGPITLDTFKAAGRVTRALVKGDISYGAEPETEEAETEPPVSIGGPYC